MFHVKNTLIASKLYIFPYLWYIKKPYKYLIRYESYNDLFFIQRHSKKQPDSLENIQLYSKFVGEASAYSEISESNQNGQVST